MGPGCGGAPQGELASQINTDFGSFEAFKKELTSKSAAVKGISNRFLFAIFYSYIFLRFRLGMARME